MQNFPIRLSPKGGYKMSITEPLSTGYVIVMSKNEKPKQNTAYSANDNSCGGKTVLESTETETTRSSRGRTRLDRLVRQRVHGIRKNVRFNKLGQPVGEFAGEMQSYIGVLVREKVKISYQTWKMVPNDVKDLIWESVNLTYNVDQSWKKGCLNSANNKWRQFKSFLTQKFILSKRDNTEDLKEPPIGFGITRDDWSSFVISSLSDDFLVRFLICYFQISRP
ncbi:uncharacterized protein [Primulina huaijiensis]|uniref:uncharacterized protein n=1 Tax=Primulina huaijiensis TaxID=1492673 RepID=UPI003CC7213F